MPKEFVDTRKLKDSASELLKKGKLEKAVDVLEQLAKHEPKDTSHRLRLGDAYRRIGDAAKAISWYQTAAKIFSDQDQLLKAIGAVKVILEIDPRNEMAQRELQQMNDRRFARPTLESAGLAPQRPAPRAPAAIDLPPATGPVISARLENPARSRSAGRSALMTAPSTPKPSVPRAVLSASTAVNTSSIVAHSGIPAVEPAVVATPRSSRRAAGARLPGGFGVLAELAEAAVNDSQFVRK